MKIDIKPCIKHESGQKQQIFLFILVKGIKMAYILHLEYSGNTGGIEKLCKDIGINAKKDKHYFIFVHEGGVFYEQMKESGLDTECLHLENKDIVKLYRHVRKFAYENRIDTIIIHHPAPLMWLSMLLYLEVSHNAKVLVYVHNTYDEITKYSKTRKKVYDELLKKCDGIITISEFVKKTVINHTDISEEKVKVIYNGVKCLNLTNAYKGSLNNPIKIIYVGRLIEKKGVQILLKAIALLKDRTRYAVQIIGDGPYRVELEKMSKDLQITQYVKFYGNQRNVTEWLTQADIFIHPAIWQEGFGITIVEALSCGKICIASNRGAIPEIIEDGKNGFLFDAENPDALAKKIRYVCNTMSDEQRLSIQQNAIAHAQNFSIEKLLQQLHEYVFSLKGN